MTRYNLRSKSNNDEFLMNINAKLHMKVKKLQSQIKINESIIKKQEENIKKMNNTIFINYMLIIIINIMCISYAIIDNYEFIEKYIKQAESNYLTNVSTKIYTNVSTFLYNIYEYITNVSRNASTNVYYEYITNVYTKIYTFLCENNIKHLQLFVYNT